MKDAVWIEIVSPHRQVMARHRLLGGEVRIGRGYDNDLVLDDPHVAAQHLILTRDTAGRWIAEDLGSVNGLRREAGGKPQPRLELDGDQPIWIGRTLLRVRDSAYPVIPERPLGRERPLWLPAGIVLILATGLSLLLNWERQTTEPQISQILIIGLTSAGLIALWAGLWSLIGRLFAGRAAFDANLLKAALALLTLTLWIEATEFLTFVFSAPSLEQVGFVGSLVLGGGFVFWQLQAISPAWPRLKAAILAPLVILPALVGFLGQREALNHDGTPPQVSRLYPPVAALLPRHSTDAFFAAAAKLQPEIDAARVAHHDIGGGDAD
jgi:hypothetical protein